MKSFRQSFQPRTDAVAARFLGARAVRLLRAVVNGGSCVLGLSSRTWLNYTFQGVLHFAPLLYDGLDCADGFSAELCPEGLIGVVGNSLRYVNLTVRPGAAHQSAVSSHSRASESTSNRT